MKNLIEEFRDKVKNIFKESEEFEPVADETTDAPVDAGAEGAPAVAGDESDGKQTVTITKALLTQLLDLAAGSAASELPVDGGLDGEGDLGLDADAGLHGDETADVGLEDESAMPPVSAEPSTVLPPTVSPIKTAMSAPVKPALPVKPSAPIVAPLAPVVDEAAIEEPVADLGADMGAPVDGGLDVGSAGGEVTDLDGIGAESKPVNVSALVDKVLELASAKEGAPLDVDSLEDLKAAASGEVADAGLDDVGAEAPVGDEAGDISAAVPAEKPKAPAAPKKDKEPKKDEKKAEKSFPPKK